MKNSLNLKKMSLFALLMLSGATSAFGMEPAPHGMHRGQGHEISVPDEEVERLFNHITTYDDISDPAHRPFIRGFHHHRIKPIVLRTSSGQPSGYLSIIEKDLWVYSPTNPNDFHFGRIFYKGKLIKPKKKTFFPSSMTEEDLESIIGSVIALTKYACKPNFEDNEPRKSNIRVRSLQVILTVLIRPKTKEVITIFPNLDRTSLNQNVEPSLLESIRREQADSDGLQLVLMRAAEQGDAESACNIAVRLGLGDEVIKLLEYKKQQPIQKDTSCVLL